MTPIKAFSLYTANRFMLAELENIATDSRFKKRDTLSGSARPEPLNPSYFPR